LRTRTRRYWLCRCIGNLAALPENKARLTEHEALSLLMWYAQASRSIYVRREAARALAVLLERDPETQARFFVRVSRAEIARDVEAISGQELAAKAAEHEKHERQEAHDKHHGADKGRSAAADKVAEAARKEAEDNELNEKLALERKIREAANDGLSILWVLFLCLVLFCCRLFEILTRPFLFSIWFSFHLSLLRYSLLVHDDYQVRMHGCKLFLEAARLPANHRTLLAESSR
jgi:hypothetical protein